MFGDRERSPKSLNSDINRNKVKTLPREILSSEEIETLKLQSQQFSGANGRRNKLEQLLRGLF